MRMLLALALVVSACTSMSESVAPSAGLGPRPQSPDPRDAAAPVPSGGESDGAAAPIVRATAIAAGNERTCAVLETSQVACFRPDGTGATAVGFPVDAAPLEVAVGSEHACARTANGKVYCWGANEKGQLGNGALLDQDEPPAPSAVPVEVKGLAHVIAISAGSFHTCALVSDSDAVPSVTTVRCWGRQRSGALGNGFASSLGVSSPVAIAFENGGNFPASPVKLASRFDTTVVILSDNTVWWWGEGGFEPQAFRATPLELKGVENPSFMIAGGGAACALSSQTLACWNHDAPDAHRVAADVTSVGLGKGFACGLKATREIVCEGRDVSRVGIDRVAVGDSHLCTLESGTVWCGYWSETSNSIGWTQPMSRMSTRPGTAGAAIEAVLPSSAATP